MTLQQVFVFTTSLSPGGDSDSCKTTIQAGICKFTQADALRRLQETTSDVQSSVKTAETAPTETLHYLGLLANFAQKLTTKHLS